MARVSAYIWDEVRKISVSIQDFLPVIVNRGTPKENSEAARSDISCPVALEAASGAEKLVYKSISAYWMMLPFLGSV